MSIDLNTVQFKIINELLTSSKPLSSKFLANSHGVSSKTIRTYMISVEKLLNDYGVSLMRKTGKGYWIEIFDEEKFRLLQSKFQNNDDSVSVRRERAHYLIREILCSERKLMMEDIENMLYLNQTSLKQSLTMARNLLQRFDVYINYRPKEGFCVNGQEHDIRFALVFDKCYYDKCELQLDTLESYDKYNFQDCLINQIKEIVIEEQENFFDLHLNDYSLDCVARLLLISSSRNHENKHVDYEDTTIAQFTNRNCYYIAKIVTDRCMEELGLNLLPLDIVMLSITFVGWRTLLDEKAVSQTLILRAKNAALEVVQYLQKENNFRYIGKDITLINSISLYLTSFFVRSEYHLKRSQFLIEDTNNISIMSRKLAMQSLAYLHKKYGTVVNVEEIVRLANIIHPYFGRYPHVISKLKICVVSDIDLYAGYGIKERLERNFGVFISKCDVKNLYEFKRCKYQEYQMIFTSYPSREFNFVDSEVPIIHVDVFFDEPKKISIHESFFYYPRLDDDIMRQIMKKDHFHFDVDCKNKDECIRLIGSSILMDKQDSYTEYIDDITLCDELYCVSPKNNVVLITGLQPHLERMAVHVCVLKKPISWGEDGKKAQILVYWDQGKRKEDSYYFECGYLPHLLGEIFMDKMVIDEVLSNFDYENLMLYMQALRTQITLSGSNWR